MWGNTSLTSVTVSCWRNVKRSHLGKLRPVWHRYGWSRITPVSACRPATAGAGVIRAEVIDGSKSSQFTKWGRKYLPGTAWKDRTLLNKEAHHRDVMGFFNLIPGRHSYKILRISNYRDLRPATTSPCRRSSLAALCTHTWYKWYVSCTFGWHP